MKTKYRVGDSVYISNEALENYGEQWRDIELIVTHAATQYMPAKEFFQCGRPLGYHPGYDSSVSPQALYDFKQKDNGKDVPFSLYDWELS